MLVLLVKKPDVPRFFLCKHFEYNGGKKTPPMFDCLHPTTPDVQDFLVSAFRGEPHIEYLGLIHNKDVPWACHLITGEFQHPKDWIEVGPEYFKSDIGKHFVQRSLLPMNTPVDGGGFVLRRLCTNGPMTADEIALEISLSAPTVKRLLEKLEEKGLVVSVRKRLYGRGTPSRLFVPTPLGREEMMEREQRFTDASEIPSNEPNLSLGHFPQNEPVSEYRAAS